MYTFEKDVFNMSMFINYLTYIKDKYGVNHSEILDELALNGIIMTKSCLSHKLKGDRQLVFEEFECILNVLNPTVSETKKLRFLYQNYEYGESKYEEVIAVKDFIEQFADDNVLQIHRKEIDLASVSLVDETMMSSVLYQVLSNGWTSDVVKIMCQPDNKQLSDILLNLSDKATVQVRQIVRFNSDYKSDNNSYNIKCLGMLNRIIMHNENHSVRYFYNNMDLIINSTTLFPFFVSTNEYVLLISYDYKKGYLVHEPSFVSEYRTQFDQIYQSAQELYQRIENDIEYMQLCYKIEQEGIKEFYTLQYHPCIRFNGNTTLSASILKDDYPFKDDVMQFLQASWANGEKIKGYHMYSPYGEKDFFNRGITTDMSPLIFNPVPPESRQPIMRKLKENKTQLAIRLKEDFVQIPHRLSIVCYDSGIVLFSIRGQYGIRLVLKERSLYKSMMKFCEYAIKYEQE